MTFLEDASWWVWVLVFLAAAWELSWRIPALWRSARNGQKVWFGVLLVVNSLGILPILYLLSDGKKSDQVEVE